MEMYRKIGKAEFKCPIWFPSDVCRLLSKILAPNPNTRISIAKIMENPWFRKGHNGKLSRICAATKEVVSCDFYEAILTPSNGSGSEKSDQHLRILYGHGKISG